MKLNFTANTVFGGEDAKTLVFSLTELTKMAIPKYNSENILHTKYTSNENYKELNDRTKAAMLKYCAKRAGLTDLDLSKAENIAIAFTNEQFQWNFFSIQTQALNAVQADNELEDAMQLANITTVGLGDSMTYEVGAKSLYDVQDGAYGNNTSRYQSEMKSGITLTPEPKIAAVEIDLVLMFVNNYDFGKQMAKIVMSFRTKMYADIINAIYTIATVPTAFREAAFAKTSYVKLAERVAAANSAGVTALGTRAAFVSAANNVNTGYATQDEINKTGFIGNLYGVRTAMLKQAVDSNSAAYAFRVPDDRILLISAVGDKPAKVVREGSIMVTDEDGRYNSIYNRVFKYQDSWKAGIATQAHYGIQSV
jgi:hypothetical protein